MCFFVLPRLVLEFNLIYYAFGQLPVVICTWWAMFLSTLSVPYFLFQHWARGYSKSSHPVIHSFFHGLLLMVFQIGILGCGPTYVVLAYTLPPASRCIVIFEQVSFWALLRAVLRSVKIMIGTKIILSCYNNIILILCYFWINLYNWFFMLLSKIKVLNFRSSQNLF